MPPTLHFVCDAHYNDDPVCRDPGLDRFGLHQCAQLAANFPYHDKIDVIASSPLSRAIETAINAFPSFVQRGGKIKLNPLLTEHRSFESDQGSERCLIRYRFSDYNTIDTTLISRENWQRDEAWCHMSPAYVFSRGREIRNQLAGWIKKMNIGHDDSHFVFVTHQFVLSLITENVPNHLKFFRHGECRSYQFINLDKLPFENRELIEVTRGPSMTYPPMPLALPPPASSMLEDQVEENEGGQKEKNDKNTNSPPWLREYGKRRLAKHSTKVEAEPAFEPFTPSSQLLPTPAPRPPLQEGQLLLTPPDRSEMNLEPRRPLQESQLPFHPHNRSVMNLEPRRPLQAGRLLSPPHNRNEKDRVPRQPLPTVPSNQSNERPTTLRRLLASGIAKRREEKRPVGTLVKLYEDNVAASETRKNPASPTKDQSSDVQWFSTTVRNGSTKGDPILISPSSPSKESD